MLRPSAHPPQRRRRSTATAVVVTALSLIVATPAAAQERAGAITRWIEVELDEIASHRTNPPRAARALALLSVAMRDATRLPGREREAAVAGAATTVLTYLYQDHSAAFEELARADAQRPGFALGRQIGERMIARARRDGAEAVWQGQIPAGPGLWVPTPPALVPQPLEPLAGSWKPWNLAFGSQFRPPRPPALSSRRYLRELREVYDVSRTLTAEQKRVADYWADGAGTATPPGHWNRIALDLIHSRPVSGAFAARVLAALNTAQADAFIACWDAKFTYWTERPVTAIQRELDPAWVSYIATPPFPSYVSGHSTTSGAAAEVLGRFFPAVARRLRGMAEEAAVSRLYGGIHFRSDNQAGLVLGRRIARAAIAKHAPRLDRTRARRMFAATSHSPRFHTP
jgi:membrane-associated phospholipid phosphatase